MAEERRMAGRVPLSAAALIIPDFLCYDDRYIWLLALHAHLCGHSLACNFIPEALLDTVS